MSLRFITTLVLSIVYLTPPAWADFETGMDAYNREDYATALREWRILAEQGNALAQAKLGLMYKDGLGVLQDFIQAHKWYNLAGANGDKFATESRDRLAERMTPAQIAEAQQLAREWQLKHK